MKKATTPQRNTMTIKTSLMALALMTAFLGGSKALALDPMGPPAAGLQHGQFKAGIDYSHSEMDLELNEGTWVEFLDGAFSDEGDATSFTLKNFKTNRTYANLGYGVADICEVFLRVGGANAKFGDSLWEDEERFDSSSGFALGGGIKATFLEEGNLKLGGLFQMSWSEYSGLLDAAHWAAPDFVEVDIAEIQIGVGATYMLSDRASVYAGPFLHFVGGDLDDVYSEVDGGGGQLTSHYSWNIKQDSIVGIYVGTQLELTENCSFNVELQGTASAQAVGASLAWRF
ncbi:MAG: hypothetical protein ABIF19_17405 [Planctomycetota bacterium]